MQIKTIITVAGVNEIDFGNDDSQPTAHFYWFKNLSDSTLYVSAKSNPVAGADDVAELAAKSAASVETDEGKVYVLGAGKAEIHRTNSKFCPFELPSTGSDGGSSITVDSNLSETSTNPLQNKATTAAINEVKTNLLTKADKVHTHTKDDITDFPDSLPANGGNADTVDNKHSTDFSQNTVLTSLNQVDDPNLASGISSVEGVNIQFTSSILSVYCMLIVNKHRATPGYGTQIAIPYDNGLERGAFYRNCSAGTWQPWARLNDGGNADTVDGLHADDFALKTDLPATVSNPNLLINPDFKVNQRGVSGTFSGIKKYFVDRWQLVSGTVTVNSDGTLTLNGSICQPLENAVGSNVTASVSAGTAVYDDTTKTFTITGNGDVISWAKLEIGSTATDFSPPDPTTELLKCYRFFYRIGKNIAYPNHLSNTSRIACRAAIIKIVVAYFQLPVEMRDTPTILVEGTPWCFDTLDTDESTRVTVGASGTMFSSTKTGYQIGIRLDDHFTADIDGYITPLGTGYTDFNAEII